MTTCRRLLALALLLFAASGCTRWGGHPLPEPSSGRGLPDPLRVTRADHSVLVLRDAVIVGDSVVGFAGPEHARAAVALADVRSVQARKLDFLGTVGAAAGVYLVATAAVLLAILASWGE